MALESYQVWSERNLYGPCGYYTTQKARVGRKDGTDFYTASSVGVFKLLLAEALRNLAAQQGWTKPILAEVGCERGQELFAEPPAGFASVEHYPLGCALELKPTTIIFSNELLDAQPFVRCEQTSKGWVELGLDAAAGRLDEVLGVPSAKVLDLLPRNAPVGWKLDLSVKALELVEKLVAGEAPVMFVAFDYGLDSAQLAERAANNAPAATARAYKGHEQLGLEEVLSLPEGSYDITTQVLWGQVAEVLEHAGLRVLSLTSQEAFLIKQGQGLLPQLNQEQRRELATLVHPANMGQKFQVMVAVRGE